jgi:hypothetical protein
MYMEPFLVFPVIISLIAFCDLNLADFTLLSVVCKTLLFYDFYLLL